MVFDQNMNPVWCNSPEGTRKWLEFRIDNDPLGLTGYTVRTGWPQQYLTVSAYLSIRKSRRGRI